MAWNAIFSGKRKRLLFRLWNFWPPFLGAGIHIGEVSPDLRSVKVHLRLRWWNRNYVGTQFGGSMFMMTDPFFMVMFLQNLGRDYIVWDKVASIRYLKPGRTHVTAHFQLTEEILLQIRRQLENQEKMDWQATVPIKDENGETVAEVDKVIYIRRKKKTSDSSSES
jgi:hypothetical protein